MKYSEDEIIINLKMYRPTAKGYFSGCGGMEIGIMQAGINVIQSLDLDKEATDCMKSNSLYFSHSILTTDIKDKTVLEQPKTDVIVGTYPCTKYSPIADIHGTRTGDDLFLHFFRHIAIEKPEMYIVENVPGMKKFKVVMEAMTKLPDYYVNVFCPVDAALWLPQRRKRLILIGTRKRFNISAPTQDRKRVPLKNILEKDPDVGMPDYVLRRIKGKYRDLPIVVDASNSQAIAPTCVAHYAKDLSTRLVTDKNSKYGVRPFSIREYARLQGFPDDFKFENKRSSYRLIGNAVPVHMGKWIGEVAMKYFN
jgi:DNA (cytosine-5)-methyltransferase 1